MNNQVQYHFKADIGFDNVEIYDVQPKYKADFSQFDMSKLFYGMPDLEYDQDVPEGFGK